MDKLQRTYQDLPPVSDPQTFVKNALDALSIRLVVRGCPETIPQRGPLLVVANHPFGGIEGLVAAQMVLAVRSDVKIMANAFLSRIPEMAPLLFGVDPFRARRSIDRNIGPLRMCFRWLKGGGVLIMFPSGTVSHFHLRKRAVVDPSWSETLGRLVLRSRCAVVPMHFEGANSLWFHLLGLMHPRLRTLLLPREMHGKCGRTIPVTVGRTIYFDELAGIGSAAGMTEYLRAQTYALGISHGKVFSKNGVPQKWLPLGNGRRRPPRDVAPGMPAQLLLEEMEKLPSAQCLVSSGCQRVYWASATQIPHVLQEIGRLREIAFRVVGEGSGLAVDLDRFDLYYHHLFLWHEERREIIGAYRIGRGDEILKRMGLKGFYTSTLFRYGPGMMPLLERTLELGRSFVRPEHQKAYAPLWLLWRGIARYVALHVKYRYLLGPVSISESYHVISRHLMVMFLRHHYFCTQWSRWVEPRRPPRLMSAMPWNVRVLCRDLADVDLVSELVATIEKSERSVPVLLRQYLKVGGKVLGFNVDKNFSHVLDALLCVDLAAADLRFLKKAMGGDAALDFLAYHQGRNAEKLLLSA
ncbi:lysophospholipid acyltransferase family protein [Desulfosoma sp.]|uniref:lysophospholipid acyltransferase family protein n=1 Tax=Desulfosoma sp. TaxID=2603217 RepID=UPI00404B8C71